MTTTKKEERILRYTLQGLKLKEIAYRMGVNLATIETHRIRMMRKHNVRSLVGLIRLAIRDGHDQGVPIR